MGVLKRALDKATLAGRKAARSARKAGSDTSRKTLSAFLSAIRKVFIAVIFPIILKLLVIIIFLGSVWSVISNLVISTSVNAVSTFVGSAYVSSSLEGNYEASGSLVQATDSDVAQMASGYVKSIRTGDLSYLYDEFTTSIENPYTDNSGVYLETSTGIDPIDFGENFTLYEHILNTERYNFNRIKWVKYVSGEHQAGTPTLTVDAATRLQYPQDDEYDLSHFVSMARPYLQSWVIPMSMASGFAANANTDDIASFALATIYNGYHKIEIAQHVLEAKTRENKYKIYDEKTTNVIVTRTCKKYQYTTSYTCTDEDLSGGGYDCTLHNRETTITKYFEVCNDEERNKAVIRGNIRENISSTDAIKTENNYVLSSVQAFDVNIVNKYDVTKRYEDTNPYNEDSTKADSYNSKAEDYTNTTVIKNPNFVENTKTYDPISDPEINTSSLRLINTTETVLAKETIIEQTGKQYTDTFVWKDKLQYNAEGSKIQEGYTVQQLKDSLWEDVEISTEEEEYYTELETEKKLNLIDIFNADQEVYYSYTEIPVSDFIGYNRSQLTSAYETLKTNLADLYSNYPYSISYGQSLVPNIKPKNTLANSYDYSWLSEGSFGWPVPGNKVVGHLFGYTTAYFGYDSYHSGLDLWPDSTKPAYQTEVVAARAGTISVCKDLGYPNVRNQAAGWGNYIKIDHGDGTHTLYAHLNTGSFFVRQGEHVEAGQVIAHMGSSGNSTGTHLHFELYNGDERVDPLIYIYNVKSIGSYPEYETLTDDQKFAISTGGQYEYVSSK